MFIAFFLSSLLFYYLNLHTVNALNIMEKVVIMKSTAVEKIYFVHVPLPLEVNVQDINAFKALAQILLMDV